MSNIHTPDTVKAQIQADITAANTATNASDTTIHDAVQSLINGFGVGDDPVLQELTITENGEYTPSEGFDGFSKVIAVIAGSGTGLAYDMGEFVIEADANGGVYVPHNLGEFPDFILVWSDDFAGLTNNYGNTTNLGFMFLNQLTGVEQRLTSTNRCAPISVNFIQDNGASVVIVSAPSSGVYTQGYQVERGETTDKQIRLTTTGTQNYYRAGITYKYFVSKAWWNTNLGGTVND